MSNRDGTASSAERKLWGTVSGTRDHGQLDARHLKSRKDGRARARVRSPEREWLEEVANPDKKLSGAMKRDFETALELLLEQECPRAFEDTFYSACYLADIGESTARGYMRGLTSSQGLYMIYQEGGVRVLDYRTTGGTA